MSVRTCNSADVTSQPLRCREKEIIEERETFVLQQSEKDQQYSEIVRRLKDRVSN